MHKETNKCIKIQCKGRLKNGNETLLLISEKVNKNQFLGLWEGSPSSCSIDRDDKGVFIHKFWTFPLLYYSHNQMKNYNKKVKEKININETIRSRTN